MDDGRKVASSISLKAYLYSKKMRVGMRLGVDMLLGIACNSCGLRIKDYEMISA